MNIIEYTINIGGYDPERKDLICITDYDLFRNNARNSRAPKILSHKWLDCDVSIYWDANQVNISGLTKQQIVDKYLGDCDIAAQICTTGKDCVYQEIKAAKGRINSIKELKILEQQAKHYRKTGVPEHIGTLSGFQPLIRRHNERVKRFNEDWWAELCRWSYRDQVSFPVVLARHPELKVKWVSVGDLGKKILSHGSKIFPKEI